MKRTDLLYLRLILSWALKLVDRNIKEEKCGQSEKQMGDTGQRGGGSSGDLPLGPITKQQKHT